MAQAPGGLASPTKGWFGEYAGTPAHIYPLLPAAPRCRQKRMNMIPLLRSSSSSSSSSLSS
eukprot:841435-Pyramimonas_sp.AAC.1